MQEYTVQLREAFQRGLRPEPTIPKNSQILTQCKYLKPHASGLAPTGEVVDPFAVNAFDTFPFPQLFRGVDSTLLVGATTLKTVNESTWGTTNVAVYDSETLAVGSITTGELWHFIDLGKAWLLLNGSCTVFNPGIWTLFGETEKVLVQSDVAIQTGCALLGRVIFGGLDPADFTHVDWESMRARWVAELPYAVDDSLDIGNTSFIWLSTIGGGDVFSRFYTNHAVDGLIQEDDSTSDDDPMYMDLLKRNEAGFMPMPWQGTVYNVKPLAKGAMVYGDKGIAYIFPVIEPIPTYGVIEVAEIGVAGRGAVGGDSKRHLIVDAYGALWLITPGPEMQRLGYVEYISPMLDGSNIVITYNKARDWFYISGDDGAGTDYSYVLTKQGLGETPQLITSGLAVGEDFAGIFDEPIATETGVVTDTIDFGNRDFKTITTVELSMAVDADTVVSIAVAYRNDSYGDWTESSWKVVNSQGWMRVQQTAVEFRFAFKFSTYVDTHLMEVAVHYQQPGKRTIRGLSVNAINAVPNK